MITALVNLPLSLSIIIFSVIYSCRYQSVCRLHHGRRLLHLLATDNPYMSLIPFLTIKWVFVPENVQIVATCSALNLPDAI